MYEGISFTQDILRSLIIMGQSVKSSDSDFKQVHRAANREAAELKLNEFVRLISG